VSAWSEARLDSDVVEKITSNRRINPVLGYVFLELSIKLDLNRIERNLAI
jgi:hypothetical protein